MSHVDYILDSGGGLAVGTRCLVPVKEKNLHGVILGCMIQGWYTSETQNARVKQRVELEDKNMEGTTATTRLIIQEHKDRVI